jgi:diguanylate cyclase (GGDEF)-like protein
VANERQLSEVLREFARTMVTDFPIQAILDRLTERIVDVMPISAAGVTLISPGSGHYVSASNASALRFEQLQTELEDGPCLAAYNNGVAISVPDIRTEVRFPRFAPRALEAGLAAVFTFPLHYEDHQLGALDLYRDSAGPLSSQAMTAAQTLADVAAAYLINAQARADLQQATDRLLDISLHDGLTGLPNRLLMLERLETALVRCRRSGLTIALLFLDLDRFKAVNDMFGHSVGDELLVAAAKRLSGLLRPGDSLARLSGDEFVIVCEDLTGPSQADQIVQRLKAALARPFALSGVELGVTASVGVALTGPTKHSASEVLHAADMAMYEAKRSGPGVHRVLDLGAERLGDDQASLASDLGGLLERDELHLEYQPIVATVGGQLTGVEALLRWEHPRLGPISPSVVIPIAERLGLIPAIGGWVLRQALSDECSFQEASRTDRPRLSVNVSTLQLMAPGFTNTVADLLDTWPGASGRLISEITESVFVRDAERALVVLNDLRDIGVRVALDDFGTGYSSLAYLLRFPVDIVKIDRAFVVGLARDRASQLLVSAVIDLAHGLEMTVVAEGVETSEQHHELMRLGCDSCQGFYFASPMVAPDLVALVKRRGDGTERTFPVESPPGDDARLTSVG